MIKTPAVFNWKRNFVSDLIPRFALLVLLILLPACTTDLQTKVSGNLGNLSHGQTIAILPVEVVEPGQAETAALFRQSLYANLKDSDFKLLERYVVDGLLQRSGLNDPSQYHKMNPMVFGEVLGADAVVISRINKVERSYLIIHSSIEVSISAEMMDTRSGEILWRAEQTESDFQGLGKIPTGYSSAILAPIQFVTNKFNLHQMTTKMVNKLTSIFKKPEDAEVEERFDEMHIARAATRDLEKIQKIQNLKSKWREGAEYDSWAYADEGDLPPLPGELQTATRVEDISQNGGPGSSEQFRTEPGILRKAGFPVKEPAEESPDREIGPAMRNMKITTRNKTTQPEEPSTFKSEQPSLPQAMNTASLSYPQHEKQAEPSPGKSSSLLYTVQVGAYKTETNAKKMVKSMNAKGYNAFMTIVPKDENNTSPIYRVQVEKLENREQALQLANHLKTKENIKGFLTTMPKGS